MPHFPRSPCPQRVRTCYTPGMTNDLTKSRIQALVTEYRATPGVVDQSIPDTGAGAVTGLAVRVQRRRPEASLSVRWVCRRRIKGGTPVRVVIGDALTMPRDEARKRAFRALNALIDGKNPNDERRAAARQREAERAAARRWRDVLDAYATPDADTGRRPAPYTARRLVARWFHRADQERRDGGRNPGVSALAVIANCEVSTLAIPTEAARLFVGLAPLLAVPETAPRGARHDGVWGPFRSRASTLKMLRVCSGAWNADPSLPRATNPWAAWRHQSAKRLQPPPPVERQLLFPLTAGSAKTRGPEGAQSHAARWIRALAAVRHDAQPDTTLRAQADWLLCCALWGCRATEAALLTWRDIALENTRTPHVTFRAGTTKVGTVGHRPLLPIARAVLDARRPRASDLNAWVFPGAQCLRNSRSHPHDDAERLPRDATYWTAATVTPLLERITRCADPIAARSHAEAIASGRVSAHAHTTSPLWITPHDLRRSIAGWLLAQSGLPEQAASMVLDHATRSTTAGYQQHREQRLRAQVPIYERWEAVIRALAPALPR